MINMNRLPFLFLLLTSCSSLSTKSGLLFQQALSSNGSSSAYAAACDAGSDSACALSGKQIPEWKTPGALGILQGPSNATTVTLSVVAPKALELTFAIIEDTTNPLTTVRPVIAQKNTFSDRSTTAVHQMLIEDLKPNSRYILEVVNSFGKTVDRRIFATANLGKKNARIAIASCLSDAYRDEQATMWRSVETQDPDLILLIGDNVYADTVMGRYVGPQNGEGLWKRYSETFGLLHLYKFKHLKPILAVWDDHDYGTNDGDRTNPYRLEALKVLQSFFPQTTQRIPEFQTGPGASSILKAFGLRIAMLDDRSFRSPTSENQTEPEKQTHFGSEQEDWLFSQKDATSLTLLISGDQWFGGYHRFESYERNHPKSLEKFLARLKHFVDPALFISGDRHLSEVMKIEPLLLGYETYEVTSSAIHSKTHPSGWDKTPNPRQIRGKDLVFQYTVIDFESDPKAANGTKLRGRSITYPKSPGAQSEIGYEFNLKVKRKP